MEYFKKLEDHEDPDTSTYGKGLTHTERQRVCGYVVCRVLTVHCLAACAWCSCCGCGCVGGPLHVEHGEAQTVLPVLQEAALAMDPPLLTTSAGHTHAGIPQVALDYQTNNSQLHSGIGSRQWRAPRSYPNAWCSRCVGGSCAAERSPRGCIHGLPTPQQAQVTYLTRMNKHARGFSGCNGCR